MKEPIQKKVPTQSNKKELKSIAGQFHLELLASTDKFNKALNLKPRDKK